MSVLKIISFFILSTYFSIYKSNAHQGFSVQNTEYKQMLHLGGPGSFNKPKTENGSCVEIGMSHECISHCVDIYKGSNIRRCFMFDVKTIEKIKHIHTLLIDPNAHSLETVSFRDFRIFYTPKTFFDIINSYTEKEAKQVLLYVAENADIAELLASTDDDYLILKKLLRKAEPNGDFDENMWKYFTVQLDQKVPDSSLLYHKITDQMQSGLEPQKSIPDPSFNRLMEGVIRSRNEYAHNYFLDFIMEEQRSCADEGGETTACFKQFCKIGIRMDSQLSQDWLNGFEEFDNYIKNIIDSGIKGSQATGAECWDTNDIREVGDINNWLNDLCMGLSSDSGTTCLN